MGRERRAAGEGGVGGWVKRGGRCEKRRALLAATIPFAGARLGCSMQLPDLAAGFCHALPVPGAQASERDRVLNSPPRQKTPRAHGAPVPP